MRHPKRTARNLALAALAALLATACSAEPQAETASSAGDPVAVEKVDDDPDAVQEVDGDPDATAEVEDPGADGAVADVERQPATSDQALPPAANPTSEPIATVEGSNPFERLDVMDLRRDGDALTLDFVIHIPEGAGNVLGVSVEEVFTADQDTYSVLAETDPDVNQFSNPKRHSVSGVTLVDRDNSNRHLVLRDSTGACLCTRFTGSLVSAGESYRHSAQFPAPPRDVTTMTVEVPQFPSIDGVAIREVG